MVRFWEEFWPTGRVGGGEINDHAFHGILGGGGSVNIGGSADFFVRVELVLVCPASEVFVGGSEPHSGTAFFERDDERGRAAGMG